MENNENVKTTKTTLAEIKVELIETTNTFFDKGSVYAGSNKLSHTGWQITVGDKYADELGFEEMMGLFALLTTKTFYDNRRQNNGPLDWMKTEEQHRQYDEYMRNKPVPNKTHFTLEEIAEQIQEFTSKIKPGTVHGDASTVIGMEFSLFIQKLRKLCS